MGRLFAIITAAMVLFWAGRVPADVVKVGLLADFTGAFATLAPQFQEGVEAYQALYGKTVKGPDDTRASRRGRSWRGSRSGSSSARRGS